MVFGERCYALSQFATLKQFRWTWDTVPTFCKAPSYIFTALLRIVKQHFTTWSCPSVGARFGLPPLKIIILVWNQFTSQKGLKIKHKFKYCTCFWALLYSRASRPCFLLAPHQLLSEGIVETAWSDWSSSKMGSVHVGRLYCPHKVLYRAMGIRTFLTGQGKQWFSSSTECAFDTTEVQNVVA